MFLRKCPIIRLCLNICYKLNFNFGLFRNHYWGRCRLLEMPRFCHSLEASRCRQSSKWGTQKYYLSKKKRKWHKKNIAVGGGVKNVVWGNRFCYSSVHVCPDFANPRMGYTVSPTNTPKPPSPHSPL